MSDVAYAGASELANDILPKMGIDVVKVDTTDLEALATAITPETKLVYLETPANPIARLTDIKIAAHYRSRGRGNRWPLTQPLLPRLPPNRWRWGRILSSIP